MKKLIFLLNITLLFSLWIGCSSSDETQNAQTPVEGDLSDSTYQDCKVGLASATQSLKIADSLLSIQYSDTSLTSDSLKAIQPNNTENAKSYIRNADASLSVVDRKIEPANHSGTRFLEIRKEADLLHVKVITLSDKAGIGTTQQANVAKRRLIIPGEEWNFDKPAVVTTDTRVNAVIAFKEQSYAAKGFEFRTVQKDSLVFDFKMYKEWIGSEKQVGRVISYNSAGEKIIVTMNNTSAQFDTLTYWTAIYEASAYGKNQLAVADRKFSSDRLASIGAEQSYLARYHLESKEIAALFLQKGNMVVSVFVEYPNGSLSSDDADIINQFLNSVKFR